MLNKYTFDKLILLLLLIIFGIATKFYSGPGREFVNNYLGGVIYVMFFILLASLILPHGNILKLSLLILIITCLLEFSQLITGEFLNKIRAHFIVRSLIGSVFNKFDFLFYLFGALIGYYVLRMLRTRTN